MVDYVVGNDMLGVMIAKRLGVRMVPFIRYYHPDGSPAPTVDLRYEIQEYEEIEGKDILTVYRRKWLPTRDDVARHLVNYPRLVGNLSDEETFNASTVNVMMPYWIGGRQDHNPRTDPDPDVRRRDKGRGLEYKTEAKMFKAVGAEEMLTFHPHFHRKPGIIEVEGLKVICLDAVPAMVKYGIEKLGIHEDAVIISPDLKPARRGKYDVAEEFARLSERSYGFVDSRRISETEKKAETDYDAKGRNVVIVDDIGSTFSTMSTAIRNIKNTNRIDAIFVHGVITKVDGLNRLNRLLHDSSSPLKSISCTHTIESPHSFIPIWDEVADLYNGKDILPPEE